MEPRSDSDAPSLDHGIESRLKRLDPNLVVTWNKYLPDPFEFTPILYKGKWPVEDPAWHVWYHNPDDRRHYYIKGLKHLGYREVKELEADAARHLAPKDIMKRHLEVGKEVMDRRMAKKAQDHQDMVAENEGRIRDLFDGKSGERTAKISSYPGQENRGTPTERFLPDAREDGWVETNEE